MFELIKVFFVFTYWQKQCKIFNRNDMTCDLQLSYNILAKSQDNGADGGEGTEEAPCCRW